MSASLRSEDGWQDRQSLTLLRKEQELRFLNIFQKN